MLKVYLIVALLILTAYFAFTTGAVFELAGVKDIAYPEMPYSVAFSDDRVNLSGHYSKQDELDREWLEEQDYKVIYTDFYGHLFLTETMYLKDIRTLTSADRSQWATDGYIWLTEWSRENNKITIWTGAGSRKTEDIK